MTDANKKLLTEFLGECWHEWEQYDGRYLRCKNPACLWHDKSVNETSTQGDGPFVPLDFTDWRVVGRCHSRLEQSFSEDQIEYICSSFQDTKTAVDTFYERILYCIGESSVDNKKRRANHEPRSL